MSDVIVVGAGPAGAATAILLAERGLDVLVLDRAAFPRPKICGEYVSPEAARVLDRLGVLKALDVAGAVPLAGMRIVAPDGTAVEGRYRPVGAWRPYRDHALAIPRETLDATLADRLRTAPVDFRERMRVVDVVLEHDRVTGVDAVDAGGARYRFTARLVVAADGRASVVAHRLGLRTAHRLQRMALVTYLEGVNDVGDVGEIFVDPPDYAILNPVAPGRVNMSVVVPLAHAARLSDRLDAFFAARVKQLTHVARRVRDAEIVDRIRALGPLAYRVAPPRVGGVMLVGDAAGFYDPFTGEGVFTALRSAELAADTAATALRANDCSVTALAAYDRARRATFAAKTRLTRGLHLVIARRRVANLTARILTRRPALLGTLLGVIGDFVPPSALLSPSVLRR
jgi:geranylgeranyl reductase family protein